MTVADWRKFFNELTVDETTEVWFHSDCCGCDVDKIVGSDIDNDGAMITLG